MREMGDADSVALVVQDREPGRRLRWRSLATLGDRSRRRGRACSLAASSARYRVEVTRQLDQTQCPAASLSPAGRPPNMARSDLERPVKGANPIAAKPPTQTAATPG